MVCVISFQFLRVRFVGCRRGTVTGLGKLMVEFPLHPGLTRAVLKAASLSCQDLLLPVAAMLSVENIFIRPGQCRSAFKTRNVRKSCFILRSRSWEKTLKYSHICGLAFLPAGNPEKQKEADKKHRALARKSGSTNDFATLLSVFQSCKSR